MHIFHIFVGVAYSLAKLDKELDHWVWVEDYPDCVTELIKHEMR